MAKDSPKSEVLKKKKGIPAGGSGNGGRPAVKREIAEGKAKVKREEEGQASVSMEKRKAGQKAPTPSPGQASREFYETLLKQKPDSHMAQEWCLAHGVLGAAEAEALYKRVCKRKGIQPAAHAPALSSSPAKKRKSASTGKARPKSSLPKEADADTGFEQSGVFEGVGTTGF
eukprot:g8568.t1